MFICYIIMSIVIELRGVIMDLFVDKCHTVCDLIYQSLRIPIYLYHGDVLQYTPVAESFVAPPYHYVHPLLTQEKRIFYTSYGACFARIDADEHDSVHFILGPVTSVRPEDPILYEMYRDYAISSDRRDAFRNYHLQIPAMTHLEFYYHLLTLFYMINGRCITMADLVPEPTEADTFRSRQKQVERMFQQKEELSYNNSMELESMLLTIIKTGNVDGIRKFVHAVPRYQAGVVANTPIRLQKNYFISTITLATRAAIAGGLSAEQAFRLSDIYITKAESLSDLQAIQTLYLQSLTDLTVQVNANLQAQRQLTIRDANQMAQNCMDYVQKHTHSPLTVQKVADALGYHRSYLSAAFSKETGMHLNDYIYRCKLEESCHLLRYTSKKIGEISDALCFSNQSHYVKRFKNLYGMTPAEYRLNYKKS